MNILLRKIHFVLLIGLTLSMPFSLEHVKITSLFIVLLTANGIPLYLSARGELPHSQKKYVFLFVSAFLIYLWSLLTSSYRSETLFILEKKLALLLLPLVLYFTPRLSQKQLRIVLLSFVLACMNAAIYSLSVATVHYVCWNDAAYFSYRILSSTLGMHAIYLSMYFCLAVAILLFLYYKKIETFSQRDKFLYFLCFFILVGTTILLAGRIAIVLLILEIMIYMFLLLRRKNSVLMSIVKGALVGVFIFSLALLPNKNRVRLKEAINYQGEYSVDKKVTSGAVVRPYIWSCATQLIKEKPLFGSGAGETQTLLTNCYQGRGYSFLTEAENNMTFNAHDQFLEVTIAAGLIGLCIFMYGVWSSISHAIKRKNMLFVTFIFIFLISCITESMLERQSGIVFFAFFNSLLFFNPLVQAEEP